MKTLFKFWAKGQTAEGNTLSTEGTLVAEMDPKESMPPQEAFDLCSAFLAREFPTVKFIEGETKLRRLKRPPK